MAKASPTQAWLWHRRLSHLKFDTINLLSSKDIVNGLLKLKYVKDHLCSSCELSKAKRSKFKSKKEQSLKEQLNILHMDLCGLMRVESINEKNSHKVLEDEPKTPASYSQDSKNKQRHIVFEQDSANLIRRRSNKHQTSIAPTAEQNGVVERRNRTMVEAA
ncbi:retrovirus-related pol polyprotein from transposon TNT 1-94 [Tanacetum coccineum]